MSYWIGAQVNTDRPHERARVFSETAAQSVKHFDRNPLGLAADFSRISGTAPIRITAATRFVRAIRCSASLRLRPWSDPPAMMSVTSLVFLFGPVYVATAGPAG